MPAIDRKQRDLVKCEDMRLHARQAISFLGNRTLDVFKKDDMLQAAIIRCVEVVGEAARLVSDDTRLRAPEIPWVKIIGIRNVLAHDYGTVDLDRIYEVAAEHLPRLVAQLDSLIPVLETDAGWNND
jgi:uncharacterized protein with HEPN domain